MENFDVQWSTDMGSPVILITGDITGDSSEKLQHAYLEISRVSPSEELIFDFKNSRYINSSGISALIRLLHKHKEKNGRFIFTGLTEHMLKVMEIVGITEFVTIHGNIEEAVKSKNIE